MNKWKALKTGGGVISAAICIMVGLSGCGGSSNTAGSSGGEISYWCTLDSNAASILTSYGELEFYQKVQDMVGVKISFTHPASGQETEQFNLKIASDSLDDIMEYSWGTYAGGPQQAISDGLILPLNSYLDQGKAPNLKKVINENEEVAKQMKTDEGEYYSFPAIGLNTISVTTGYMFRGDWLDELGLSVPETIAEWENVLTQFKNIKGASSPLTGIPSYLISNNAISGAFGCGTDFYLDNGQVKYGPLEPGYRSYIETLRDWYAAGLIDPDIFGNNSKTVESNLINGKSGAVNGGIGSMMGSLTFAAREENPEFKLVAVPFPVQKKGQKSAFLPRAWDVRTTNMAAVTTANKNPEKSVKLLDIFYGEEGSLMKNFGIEGKTYEMVDGNPVYTDEILNNPDGLSVAQALGKYTRASAPSPGLVDPRYHEQYYQMQEQRDAMAMWNEDADIALDVLLPPVTPTQEEAEELASIRSALTTFVEEQVTQFILELKDMSEYDSFVTALKGMNVEKALEIYQNAYERYQKR